MGIITDMQNPKVSVIIPTYNEEGDIEKCLDTLLKQSYKNLEIIIVDDGSTDKTRDIVKKFIKKNNKIALIEGEHKGPGFSRNLGAGKSKGKILIFVDADMYFIKDFVKNLIRPILKGQAIGTEPGNQRASNPDKIWSKCWGNYIVKEGINYKEGYGEVFRAILKKEFVKMGGFDPSLGYADDLTFYYKFGKKSKLANDAYCYHKNPETLKQVYKQSRWIGASLDNGLLKLPIIKNIVPFVLILVSPIAIPVLAVRKVIKRGELELLVPMFLFMVFRYFGTISGVIKKTYSKSNVK